MVTTWTASFTKSYPKPQPFVISNLIGVSSKSDRIDGSYSVEITGDGVDLIKDLLDTEPDAMIDFTENDTESQHSKRVSELEFRDGAMLLTISE